VAWVTHEDGSLDHVDGARRDGNSSGAKTFIGVSATAESIVEDLTSLRVSNQDELSIRALGVEGVDGRSDSRNTSNNRVGVADTSTRRLSTASGVVDGLRSGSGVCVEDEIDDYTSGTITSRGRGFTSSKDVNVGACTLLELGC